MTLAGHLMVKHKDFTLPELQTIAQQSMVSLTRAKDVCPLCCFPIHIDASTSSEAKEGDAGEQQKSKTTTTKGKAKNVKFVDVDDDSDTSNDLEPGTGLAETQAPGQPRSTLDKRMVKEVAGHLQTATFLIVRLLSLPENPDEDDDNNSSVRSDKFIEEDASEGAESDYQNLLTSDENHERDVGNLQEVPDFMARGIEESGVELMGESQVLVSELSHRISRTVLTLTKSEASISDDEAHGMGAEIARAGITRGDLPTIGEDPSSPESPTHWPETSAIPGMRQRTPNDQIPLSETNLDMASSHKSTVFRVTGLPLDKPESEVRSTLAETIRGLLTDDEQQYEVVIACTPTCDGSQTLSALVEFKGGDPKFLSQLEHDPLGDWQVEMGDDDINFDRHFFGFTQLYPTTLGHPVTAEYDTIPLSTDVNLLTSTAASSLSRASTDMRMGRGGARATWGGCGFAISSRKICRTVER